MKETILSLNNVNLTYFTDNGETQALKDINININDGDFVSIVGPSGCGKTTVLSIVSGLLKPTSGDVHFKEGYNQIGYMFQKDLLFPWLTIYKNILLGLQIQKKKTKENIAYANELLKKYGLWDFRNKHPHELSGGMKQRVALIRTLVLRPKILLLDEAFSALDFQTRLNVCDDVYKIIKEQGLTSILVTHDITEAISMSDKIIILSHRPASVIKELNIDIDKNTTPRLRRSDEKTKVYFDEIWSKLQ